MSIFNVIRKIKDVALTLVGIIFGIVQGLLRRLLIALIGFGLIALAVAGYNWVSSEYFSTVEVLVVDACTPVGCKWKDMDEDSFGDLQSIWLDAKEPGHYVAWNTTGHNLLMTPVFYGAGNTSEADQQAFTISEGWSVQTIKPDFLMTASPDTIKTYSVAGSRLNETIVKWALQCEMR